MSITFIWPGRFSITTFTDFFCGIYKLIFTFIYKLIVNLISYKNAKESVKWSIWLINYKLVKLVKHESMIIMSQWEVFYLRKWNIYFKILNLSNVLMFKKNCNWLRNYKEFYSSNKLWLMRFFENPKCLFFTKPLLQTQWNTTTGYKKVRTKMFFPRSDLIDISAITKLKSKHRENVKVINNV